MFGIALAVLNGISYLGHGFMNNVRDEQERKMALITADKSDPNKPIIYTDTRGRMINAETQKQVSYANINGDFCIVDTKTRTILYNSDEVKREAIMKKNKEMAKQEGKIFYGCLYNGHEYFKRIDDDNSIYTIERISFNDIHFPLSSFPVYVNIYTGEADFSEFNINNMKERFIFDSKKFGKSREEASKVFDSVVENHLEEFKKDYPRRK